jgi:hypothetical protein
MKPLHAFKHICPLDTTAVAEAQHTTRLPLATGVRSIDLS